MGLHPPDGKGFFIAQNMARPERNTVDYYPHIVGEGKKMYFIDKKYGNDGYATWFKILDKLAVTDYHYLNLNKEEELMFLASKCNVTEEVLLNIITDLAKLGKFDQDLWQEKIIWDQSFVDSIQEAYKKRNNKCITIQGLRILLTGLGVLKHNKCTTTGPVNTQTKVKYSKVEESKVDKTEVLLSDTPAGDQTDAPVVGNKPVNKWIDGFDNRKDKFLKSLSPYSAKNKGPYPADMLKNFFEYWSEPNKSRSRMRWETEKTWDLSKRIANWSKRDGGFGTNNQNNNSTGPAPINHDDRA